MLTAIIAILMFALLIFVHEGGHCVAAKACGIQVNEFALGMGPLLIKRKWGETEYSLRLIPIGGYCAMEGEDEESENPRAFNNKEAWKKAVVIVAGPAMNVVLALFLMIGVMYAIGMPTTTIGNLQADGPAYNAGIEVGDTIVAIDGKDVSTWDDVGEYIENGGDTVTITVDRDGKTLDLSMTPTTAEDDGRKIVGIVAESEHNIGYAIKEGPAATWTLTKQMYLIFKQLFTGEVSAKDLSGPVGIVYIVNQTAKTGLINVIYLIALISLNLAVVNLLPFPALDGGRLVFVIIRKLTGKMITDRMEAMVNYLGLLCLLALMVFVTWQDILRFFIKS